MKIQKMNALPQLAVLQLLSIMSIIPSTRLSLVQAQIASSSASSSINPVFNPLFTQEECNTWLALAITTDIDSSNSLSQDEFFTFLTSITTPSYVQDYFSSYNSTNGGSFESLPWTFRIIHKSLACRCQWLGLGENCCVGEGKAEVSFAGLEIPEEERSEIENEYRNDVCHQISFALGELIPVPDDYYQADTSSSTPLPTTTATPVVSVVGEERTSMPTSPGAPTASPGLDSTLAPPAVDNSPSTSPMEEQTGAKGEGITIEVTGSVVDYSTFNGLSFDTTNSLTAEDVRTNKDENNILDDFIFGLGSLAVDVVEELMMGGMANVIATATATEEDVVESLQKGKRNNGRALQEESLPFISSVDRIGDIGDVSVENVLCPDGLVYAPPDQLCIRFKINFIPLSGGLLNRDTMDNFLVDLNSEINSKGKLYAKVLEGNPDTAITGLGNPGAGIKYGSSPLTVQTRSVEDDDGGGISTGAYIAIIFVIIAIFVAVFALIVIRRKEQEKERLKQFAGEAARETDLEAGAVPVSARSIGTGIGDQAAPITQVESKKVSWRDDAPAAKEEVEEPVELPAPIVVNEEADKPVEETKAAEEELSTDKKEIKEDKKDDDDDESVASSAWSESNAEDSTVNESIIDDGEDEKLTVGSTLAAMGVASTVATSLYASPRDDDDTHTRPFA